MRINDFHLWLSKVMELSPSQLDQALSCFNKQQQRTEIVTILHKKCQRCPHCGSSEIKRWGNAHGLPRYRCIECHKTFNMLTGTPLARLRHREHWLEYSQALIDGLSVRKAGSLCGVSKDTAFRWRHRFLQAIASNEPTHLRGIVEVDETYFLESHKGERHLSRQPRRRGGKASKRGLSSEQVPVLIARDRNRVTLDALLPKADVKSISRVLTPVVDSDVILCSDANPIYKAFTKKTHMQHIALNLSAGIRVQENAFHIQNVNAYDSRLKGWMRHFNGVATKYLPNYLGWRRCIEKFGSQLVPKVMLNQALG